MAKRGKHLNASDLLRKWREMKGYSQAVAAKRLGEMAGVAMSTDAIQDIEQGRRRAEDPWVRIALEGLINKG